MAHLRGIQGLLLVAYITRWLQAFQVPSPAVVVQRCFASPSDFVRFCENTMFGFADGGRCFFNGGNVQVTWDQAWSVCKSFQGATMARVMTKSEYDKAFAYTFKDGRYPNSAPNSFKDTTVPTGQYCVTQQSLVYSDATTPYANLNGFNTIARYHKAFDDTCASVPRCFGIEWTDDKCDEDRWFPFCQLSNGIQSYNLTDVCLTETPYQIIQAPAVTTFEHCTQVCSEEPSCRSFNVKNGDPNSPTCELFPWSIRDACSDCPSSSKTIANCHHYVCAA